MDAACSMPDSEEPRGPVSLVSPRRPFRGGGPQGQARGREEPRHLWEWAAGLRTAPARGHQRGRTSHAAPGPGFRAQPRAPMGRSAVPHVLHERKEAGVGRISETVPSEMLQENNLWLFLENSAVSVSCPVGSRWARFRRSCRCLRRGRSEQRGRGLPGSAGPLPAADGRQHLRLLGP